MTHITIPNREPLQAPQHVISSRPMHAKPRRQFLICFLNTLRLTISAIVCIKVLVVLEERLLLDGVGDVVVVVFVLEEGQGNMDGNDVGGESDVPFNGNAVPIPPVQ
jgi:hypothetical protein